MCDGMQPWLASKPHESGCRRCGKPFRDGDVHIWACRERTRRLDADRARDGGSHAGLIRYDEISRAYPVCGDCLEALERGGHMGGEATRRLVWLLAAAVALCLVGGPLAYRLAPNFVSAFYRDGSVGR